MTEQFDVHQNQIQDLRRKLLDQADLAESCYSVGGKIKTVNNLEDGITQAGTIKISLTNSGGEEVFNNKGNLVGTITGQQGYSTILSHTALLKDGSSFITNGDVAYITGVRAQSADGTPCSFHVQENITNLTQGSGVFEDVKSVDIWAEGFISICLPDDNENKFTLSGSICVN